MLLCGFLCRNKLKINLVYTSNALLSAHSDIDQSNDEWLLGLCPPSWPHVHTVPIIFFHNCLWLRCLRYFCWNDKYKDSIELQPENRVIMTRNSAWEKKKRQSYKNWFVLWSMSKNDTHKKSFFAKYSIEHSSFLHAEGVSNLKLATGFIASFFGAFVLRANR